MSILALNWAWTIDESRTRKVVLLALADMANEEGVCWPRIATLAKRACVSCRTVQRVLRDLTERCLVIAEPRFRDDGSSTSNLYRLLIKQSEQSASPVAERLVRIRQSGQLPAPATATLKSSAELDITESHSASQPKVVEPASNDGAALDYPRALSPSERTEAAKRLSSFDPELGQRLLDELGGRLKSGHVRGTPLAYLGGLIRRALAGTFSPEAGVALTDQRQRQRSIPDMATEKRKDHLAQALAEAGAEDTPMARRLAAIRARGKRPKTKD